MRIWEMVTRVQILGPQINFCLTIGGGGGGGGGRVHLQDSCALNCLCHSACTSVLSACTSVLSATTRPLRGHGGRLGARLIPLLDTDDECFSLLRVRPGTLFAGMPSSYLWLDTTLEVH